VTAYWTSAAWLPEGVQDNVRLVVTAGVFAAVTVGCSAEPGDVRLPGMVLPGFANAHSHAFHRALRGRTHADGGSFWTWRERMYALAQRLDPDSYLTLARATYAEMALAGVTSVGEFHYLHHAPDGTSYADPNEMAQALRQAAQDAGVRLTLIDTCYLTGGLTESGYLPLEGVQRRFSDGDGEHWAARVAALKPSDGMRIAAAVHSIRAVPRQDLALVGTAGIGPLHVHLSEQPAENAACLAYLGLTPTGLLAAEGLLGPNTTVVHATHLTDNDLQTLGSAQVSACFCPTTERDLADGIGPARGLHDAGARLCLGSDQHAVIDLLEEARALELNERLTSLTRGRFSPDQLVDALTWRGHASIGWPEVGRLTVGAPADLVAIRLDSVRTTGTQPEQVAFSATAADVDTVLVDGQTIVSGGVHRLGDVAALMSAAVTPLWR
jgi:formiminoglutamate deiminase